VKERQGALYRQRGEGEKGLDSSGKSSSRHFGERVRYTSSCADVRRGGERIRNLCRRDHACKGQIGSKVDTGVLRNSSQENQYLRKEVGWPFIRVSPRLFTDLTLREKRVQSRCRCPELSCL